MELKSNIINVNLGAYKLTLKTKRDLKMKKQADQIKQTRLKVYKCNCGKGKPRIVQVDEHELCSLCGFYAVAVIIDDNGDKLKELEVDELITYDAHLELVDFLKIPKMSLL